MDILTARLRDYFNLKERKALYGDILALISFFGILILSMYNINPSSNGLVLTLSVVMVFFILIWAPVRIIYLILYLFVGSERLSVFSKKVLIGQDRSAAKKVGKPKAAKDNDVAAGFWIRLVARMIDGILANAVYVVILFITLIFIKMGKLDYARQKLIEGIIFIVYSAFFLSIDSTTPGKAFLGLRVVNAEKKKLSTGEAITRSLATIVSALSLGVGYLMILSDTEKHRALHDRIAGTLVLRSPNISKKRIFITSIVAIIVLLLQIGVAFVAFRVKFPKAY